MASADKYYVGDIGTAVIVDTLSDISLATEVKLIVRKPDNTTAHWTGSVYDTTKILYTTKAGDFNIPGPYRLQSWVRIGTGEWSGNTVLFTVWAAFT